MQVPAAPIYREVMGVSEPAVDFEARIEVYATLSIVLRSAMYAEDPDKRVL